MEILPESINRDGESAIVIQWSDGRQTRWTAAQLRDRCPCATCRERRRGGDEQAPESAPRSLPVLSAAEARPLAIASMRPVGAYAYNIAFSDGHSSGLFQLQMLHKGP